MTELAACVKAGKPNSEFWALANGGLEKVRVAVHQIDFGVDTGPVIG